MSPDIENNAVLTAHAENRAILTLQQQLPNAIVNAVYDRDELTLTIANEKIVAVCQALQAAGYNFFEDCTCVDWYPAQPRFQVTYHILSHGLKERVRLIVMLDGASASIDSITPVWAAANFYEREVFDLFGVHFSGHPNLRRIMMPDDFGYHPLRKDFPVEGYR